MIEEGVVEMSQDHTSACKAVGAWGVIYSATGAAIVSSRYLVYLKLAIAILNFKSPYYNPDYLCILKEVLFQV
jgi:hypothetical protein